MLYKFIIRIALQLKFGTQLKKLEIFLSTFNPELCFIKSGHNLNVIFLNEIFDVF